MRSFELRRARSLPEALDLLAHHGEEAQLLAGGTALVLLMHNDLVHPGLVVALTGIPELAGVRAAPDGGIEVGALTTLRDVETDPIVRSRASALAEAVGRVATVRIRNQATLGGNLVHADPAQDPPPMLLAHDAEVEIASPSGPRTIPLKDFFVDTFQAALGPGEILTAVRVPPPPVGARFAYLKFLPRTVDDYATVSVAVRLDPGPDGIVSDARIALGAVAGIPLRARAAEEALRGTRPDERLIADVAELAADATDPFADARGSAAYKREMARVWTGRVLRRLIGLEEAA